MTPSGARPPLRFRLELMASPERVGAVIAVAVALLIVVAATRPPAPGGGSIPAPTASPTATPAATVPAASASGSAAPSVPPPPTASGVAWAAAARQLVETDDEIIVIRVRLAGIGSSTTSDDIVRELRTMNLVLVRALTLVDALEERAAPADLVEAAMTMHRTAYDTSLETLSASLQNRPAYVAGARAVVAALADLETLITRLRTEAGLVAP